MTGHSLDDKLERRKPGGRKTRWRWLRPLEEEMMRCDPRQQVGRWEGGEINQSWEPGWCGNGTEMESVFWLGWFGGLWCNSLG
jgi:hypothetical protein